MPKIRVLVVDDAVVMRKLISEALSRDPAESLTVALQAGELLASLSVLESQTVISGEELAENAIAAGIPDARVFEIAQRLAVKA